MLKKEKVMLLAMAIPAAPFIKYAVSSVIAGIGWAMLYPIKRAVSDVKKEWQSVKIKVDNVEAEVHSAVTNHLHTIEDNTGKTVQILETMALEQRELAGYLRGLAERRG